ncbi:MAG: patatin family protein [Polyangiaceae bacterium]
MTQATVRDAAFSGNARSALIVEGGAMRGIFSAGVLDVFLESRFMPFDLAMGASAGASNLLSYLAGQHGRNRRCYTQFMARAEFFDPWRFVRGGHWMDLDWLWDEITREDPLDLDAVIDNPVELRVTLTSAETGYPVYLRPEKDEILAALKGSCALPIFYRGSVAVRNERFVDGAVSDPLPVWEAYRRGARRIMVVRSRPFDFVKRPSFGTRVQSLFLRNSPAVARAFETTAMAYRAAMDFIRNPPPDCEVVHVAPLVQFATGRTTREVSALERDYRFGRQFGDLAMRQWARLSEKPN